MRRDRSALLCGFLSSVPKDFRSGMRCDGEDRDLFFIGAVVPENPPSGGSPVLCIGLEDLLAAGSFERVEFVGVETGVAGIGFQQTQGLAHRFQAFGQTGIRLKRVEIGVRPRREKQFEAHGSVDLVVGKLGETPARVDFA